MIEAGPSPAPAEPIPRFVPAQPIRYEPGRLQDNESYNSLPRAFLDNLQKVMNKKWQVAEKCGVNPEVTPHEVLGFRDVEPSRNLYSRAGAVAGWVLETQQYQQHQPPSYQVENAVPRGECTVLRPGPAQQLPGQQPHYGHYQGVQHRDQPGAGHYSSYQADSGHYDSYSGMQNTGHSSYLPAQHTNSYYPSAAPVVLREPDPNYVDPARLRANKAKRPPPPPRRSENTQLSNSNNLI